MRQNIRGSPVGACPETDWKSICTQKKLTIAKKYNTMHMISSGYITNSN